MDIKDLVSIAILILTISIVIGVSANILGDLNTSYDGSATIYSTNETITITGGGALITNVAYKTGDGIVKSINTASGYLLSNGTNGTIGINNYDFNTNGSISINGAGFQTTNGDLFNFTYNYAITDGNVMYNATGYGNQSQEELGSWLPTIALVIIAAIIIGIIALYFRVM